jgi:hypothetical protein
MNQIQNVLGLLDRPIAYHRIFAELGGSVTAGVFLSQAVYWSQRTTDPDGWFWKTQKEWHEETYLKRSEQEIARRELRAAGILEEKKKGVPAKLYFRVNLETLAKLLLFPVCQDAASLDAEMEHAPSKDAEMQQTRMKSKKSTQSLEEKGLEVDFKKTDKDAESSILIYTEITPETSSKITNQDPLKSPKGDGDRALGKNLQNAEDDPAHESAALLMQQSNTLKAKHKQKGAARRGATVAQNSSAEFEQWWIEYRQFCIGTDSEAGDRAAAVKIWDLLIELEPDGNIPAQILEGTQWYAAVKFQEYKAKGQAIGVAHGCRFLSKRKWFEALEHKAAKPDYLAQSKSLSCDADALWKQVFFAISGGDCELPPIAKQAIAPFGTIRELGNQSPEWIERVLKPKFFKELQNATPTP